MKWNHLNHLLLATFLSLSLSPIKIVMAEEVQNPENQLTEKPKSRWKFRAREHFEFHRLRTAGFERTYSGFSNTINFWKETVFHESIGFAFGPILGKQKVNGSDSPNEFGQKITLYNIGGEWKKYFKPGEPGIFYRLGANINLLKTKGPVDKLLGASGYAGIGYEFLLGKVGIAPEIALRQSFFEQGVNITSFTPSIGFHFYEMF